LENIRIQFQGLLLSLSNEEADDYAV